jgi:hypothetical protein
MNGPVKENQIIVLNQERLDGLWTSIRRTFVDDLVEDPSCISARTT